MEEEIRGNYSEVAEAKFWIEPEVSLTHKYGLSDKETSNLKKVVEDRQHEIKASWQEHFGN